MKVYNNYQLFCLFILNNTLIFLGDFWPNVLEDSIKEIEMEQQKQQQQSDSSKNIEVLNNNGNPTDEESMGKLIHIETFQNYNTNQL